MPAGSFRDEDRPRRSAASGPGIGRGFHAKEARQPDHVRTLGSRGFTRLGECALRRGDPEDRAADGLPGLAGGEPLELRELLPEADPRRGIGDQPDQAPAADVREAAVGSQARWQRRAEEGVEEVEVRGLRGDAVDRRRVEAEARGPPRDRWTGGVPGHGRSRIGDRMNIIIVGRPGSAPRTIRLGAERPALVLGGAVALAAALLVGLGAVVGATIGGPALARAELADARTRLAEQSRELADAQQQVRRDMDALALRLGRLQAESTRLNALGQRLARIGKLEDGEFDFTQPPAVGGPERPTLVAAPRREDVGTALDSLESALTRQGDQLRMLETVLFDREVERTLQPAGIPVRVGYMSSGFGRRNDPFTGRPEFHGGVDFAGPRGTDILAVAGGVVSFSGTKPGYGRVVEIDHGNGYMTRYAHNDRNKVDVGDPVRPGDVIATMGNSGRASGVHVHFEVWQNGRLVNPSEYLAAIR